MRRVMQDDYDTWRTMTKDYDPTITEECALVAWKKFFNRRGDMVCKLILFNDQLAGFVQYHYHEFIFATKKTRYLSDLYVKPEFRRKGIGTTITVRLINQAQREQLGRIYWVTEPDNPMRKQYDELGSSDFVRYHIDFAE